MAYILKWQKCLSLFGTFINLIIISEAGFSQNILSCGGSSTKSKQMQLHSVENLEWTNKKLVFVTYDFLQLFPILGRCKEEEVIFSNFATDVNWE